MSHVTWVMTGWRHHVTLPDPSAGSPLLVRVWSRSSCVSRVTPSHVSSVTPPQAGAFGEGHRACPMRLGVDLGRELGMGMRMGRLKVHDVREGLGAWIGVVDCGRGGS